MELLHEIEKFLKRTSMPSTRFGRLAIRDPRLVRDLRNGRELRARTVTRVKAFLAAQECER